MIVINIIAIMADKLKKSFLVELNRRKQKRKLSLVNKINRICYFTVCLIKRTPPQFLLGLTLLFIPLTYQYNISFIFNPIYSLITQIVAQPELNIGSSPRSWNNYCFDTLVTKKNLLV